MPTTPQDYNGDAILGEQLSKLMEKEIRDRLKGDVPETIASALCAMAVEIDALKAALAASNLGERVADSLDAQSLKVGGEDVVRNVSATATVSNTTGTPSVAVTKGGTASETTFAFAFSNLKGAKGDTGANGTNGTNGTNGVSCTHSWNGTVLTVTSASGTSSADLKGSPGTPEKRSGMCTASWHKTWSSTPSGGNNPLEYYQDITYEFSSFDSSATTDSDVYIGRLTGGSVKNHILLVTPNSLNAVKWTYILELKWIGSSSLWGAKNTRILLASSTSATDYADGAYDLAWACSIMDFGGFNRSIPENPYKIIIPDYYRFISEANVISNTTLQWKLTVLWKEV